MKNKFQYLFGMDHYRVSFPIRSFLNNCSIYKIDIFDVENKTDGICFYAPIYQRSKIKRCFRHAELIKTVGCLGFIFKQLRNPKRLMIIGWCILLLQLFSHTIFVIEFQSTNEQIKNEIETYLSENEYQPPFISWDSQLEEKMKDELQDAFKTNIAWLEISKTASKIKISFNDKRYMEPKIIGNRQLIANKSGMITEFEITHGEKLVKLNQIVEKGDILVDNILLDAFNKPVSIQVEGKVWAKTWTTITASMNCSPSILIDPFHFMRLLMDCRNQMSKEISEGEEILSESVLQFDRNDSKIMMKVHYTCLEDISKS